MISLFFANLIGWIVAHWRIVLIIAAVLVLGISTAVCLKSCRKPLVVDQEALNKINSKNTTEIKKEVQKVVDDNADVVRTNDNRSAITELNRIEREKETDAKVEAATQKIIEAKSNGHDITSAELECILVPENCK